MARPSIKKYEFTQTVSGTVDAATHAVIDVSDLQDKAIDYAKGAGAAFTANLEASVAQKNWTVITALDASKVETIAGHFNFVRVNCSVAGAIGTGTELMIAGKAN